MSRFGPRLVTVVAVLAVMAATLVVPDATSIEPLFTRICGLAFVVVGLLATRREDGRRIGWLCLVLGLSSVLFDLGLGYAETTGPGAVWAYWFGQWASQFPPVLALLLLPALFPTGHVAGPRWRWLPPTAFALLAVSVLTVALTPETYDVDAGVIGRNPMGLAWMEAVGEAAFVPLVLVALGCGGAALLSLALRFHRAVGVVRLQLQWLLFAVGGTVAVVVVAMSVVALPPDVLGEHDMAEPILDVAFGFAQLLVPVAIGVALTRHGLYDLGRVVSRTVAYSVVVLLLGGTYISLVVTLGAAARAMTSGATDIVVALSTLAVAALFQPVRSRVQVAVDRQFNRGRYDAARIVDGFGRELRGEVRLEAVADKLRAAAATSLVPASAGVMLLSPEEEP